MSSLWVAVLVTAAGLYLLKVVGLSLTERVLERPAVQRVADLTPVALLAALVALLLRAPFLVVVVAAAATAALVRLL